MEIDVEKFLKKKRFNYVKTKITEYGREQLLKYILYCNENKIHISTRTSHIINLIKLQVKISWVECLRNSINIGRGTSKELCILRYGEEAGLLFYNEKTKSTSLSKRKHINKYGVESWEKACKDRSVSTLNFWVNKYGEEVGLEKFNEYHKKRVETGKLKGKRVVKLTLSFFQAKYGEIEGQRKWNRKRRNQRKRFSKKWYIEKYGEETGSIEWNNYKSRMSALSANAKSKGRSYSKISQILFKEILEFINDKDNVFFAEHNKEKIIRTEKLQEKYKFVWLAADFTYGKKIIEFDGKYWHSKPDVKKKDILKTAFLKEVGYSVLRVKEADYIKAPKKCLEQCRLFLLEE